MGENSKTTVSNTKAGVTIKEIEKYSDLPDSPLIPFCPKPSYMQPCHQNCMIKIYATSEEKNKYHNRENKCRIYEDTCN